MAKTRTKKEKQLVADILTCLYKEEYALAGLEYYVQKFGIVLKWNSERLRYEVQNNSE